MENRSLRNSHMITTNLNTLVSTGSFVTSVIKDLTKILSMKNMSMVIPKHFADYSQNQNNVVSHMQKKSVINFKVLVLSFSYGLLLFSYLCLDPVSLNTVPLDFQVI